MLSVMAPDPVLRSLEAAASRLGAAPTERAVASESESGSGSANESDTNLPMVVGAVAPA